MSERAPSMTTETGWTRANACSQPGMDWSGTKAVEAKVSGMRIGKTMTCAVSLLGAASPMAAKPQLTA